MKMMRGNDSEKRFRNLKRKTLSTLSFLLLINLEKFRENRGEDSLVTIRKISREKNNLNYQGRATGVEFS